MKLVSLDFAPTSLKTCNFSNGRVYNFLSSSNTRDSIPLPDFLISFCSTCSTFPGFLLSFPLVCCTSTSSCTATSFMNGDTNSDRKEKQDSKEDIVEVRFAFSSSSTVCKSYSKIVYNLHVTMGVFISTCFIKSS